MESVVDITIAYPHRIPQNASDILRGDFPSEIHLYVDTFTKEDIPDSKDELDLWCINRWKIKEEFLSNFYEKKTVPDYQEREHTCNEDLIKSTIFLSFALWTLLEILFFLVLWQFPILWLYVIFCTIFYVCVCKFTPGFGLIIASAMKI